MIELTEETNMLEIELAQNFVDKLSGLTEHEVSIVNEKGIVIASTNLDRIGACHPSVIEFLSLNTDCADKPAFNEFKETGAGLILPINHENKRLGAVSITGNPTEIRSIASVIKMSLEATISYELEKEKSYLYRTNKEAFINQLLFEQKLDKDRLFFLAGELSYQTDLIRIPILLRVMDHYDPSQIIDMIRVHPLHTSQDISYKTDEYHVIIFKNLSRQKNILSDYKYLIGEYLNPLLMKLKENDVKYCTYVGSFQNNLFYYRRAYSHCKWLEASLTGNTGFFFYDYVGQYLKSMIPQEELQAAFHVYRDLLDEETIVNYKEVVGSLENSNYNMVQASKNLYIHKNTMIYRFDKIREKLNVNPFSNSRDKEYLEYLYEYLKHTN